MQRAWALSVLYLDIFAYDCLTSCLQEASTQVESQLADLRTGLERQESKTRKADSKFKFSFDEIEKLKTRFAAERTAWGEENIALVQRAKTDEASLQEVTAELTSLKRHITQMTAAIFGKQYRIF